MKNLSDYEVLELFDTYIYSTSEYFMQFLAVYFAYLFAVWLAGAKLRENMVAAMLFLYTAFTVLPASGSFVSFGVASELAGEILNRGESLAPVANSSVVLYSGTSGAFIHYLAVGLQVIAYLAGLLFLREVRKGNLVLGTSKPEQPDKERVESRV